MRLLALSSVYSLDERVDILRVVAWVTFEAGVVPHNEFICASASALLGIFFRRIDWYGALWSLCPDNDFVSGLAASSWKGSNEHWSIWAVRPNDEFIG